MTDQARSLYRMLVSRGHGELDGTAVLKLYDDDPVLTPCPQRLPRHSSGWD